METDCERTGRTKGVEEQKVEGPLHSAAGREVGRHPRWRQPRSSCRQRMHLQLQEALVMLRLWQVDTLLGTSVQVLQAGEGSKL